MAKWPGRTPGVASGNDASYRVARRLRRATRADSSTSVHISRSLRRDRRRGRRVIRVRSRITPVYLFDWALVACLAGFAFFFVFGLYALSKGRNLRGRIPAFKRCTVFANQRLNSAQDVINAATIVIALPAIIVCTALWTAENRSPAVIAGLSFAWLTYVARLLFFASCFAFADLAESRGEQPAAG